MISPLLSNMEVVKCISVRGGTSVYIVRSTKSNQSYYLKHICIPESQKQVDALMFTGAATTVEDAQNYYKQVAADYQAELETLEKLSASPNIGCYRSYQIEPKEDGVGFEIYLLAEYRKTLSEVLTDTPVTQAGAVNLGLDLCSALVSLREAGLVHRNVKPSNVYLSAQGHFLLGDLGIAKIDELKYCSMPENMLSSYSAPELFSLLGTIEPTTDIYSIGMILYRVYNGNHGPFEDEKTSPRAADKLRVTGETLPAPMYADYEMAEIILKACAFKPEDRYQTPQEMQEALLEYGKRNEASDALIVPPIEGEPETIDPNLEEEIEPVQFADTEKMADDFKENFSPDTQMLNAIIDEVHRGDAGKGTIGLDENSEDASEPEADEESSPADASDEDDELKITLPPRGQRRKKQKKPVPKWILPVVIIVAVLAAIAAAVWFFVIVPSITRVNGITVSSVGTDTLTVQIDSSEPSGAFDVTCSDAYGNQSRLSYVSGADMTFDSLVPGTQYTIEAVALGGKKMTGSYSAVATTLAETTILSFTATPISVTQAELNFILQDGPDYDTWTVSYETEGAEPKTVTFSGHSVVISDLLSNSQYTFALQAPENTQLSGAVSTALSTVPTVELNADSVTIALSSSSAILTWQYTGDAPEKWVVTISDKAGYEETQEVTAPNVTFENLVSGTEYEIVISAPTMLSSYAMSVTPTITKVTDFNITSETDESGRTVNVNLDWTCETEPADPQWVVTYTLLDVENAEPQTIETTGESCVNPANNMYPGAHYSAALSLKSGEALDGETESEFTTANVDNPYKANGVSGTYTGLFLKPNKDTFRYLDLYTSRTTFSKGELIAFDVESSGTVDTSSDGTVAINLVIRDEDGSVVDAHSYIAVWKDMWEKNMFVGYFPRTPQTDGSYTLSIYIGNQLLSNAKFTVKS